MSEPADKRLRDLLMWARKHRISLGRVRVADIELDMVDLDIPDPKDAKGEVIQARPSIFEQYAGDLGAMTPTSANGVEPTEMDEDD